MSKDELVAELAKLTSPERRAIYKIFWKQDRVAWVDPDSPNEIIERAMDEAERQYAAENPDDGPPWREFMDRHRLR